MSSVEIISNIELPNTLQQFQSIISQFTDTLIATMLKHNHPITLASIGEIQPLNLQIKSTYKPTTETENKQSTPMAAAPQYYHTNSIWSAERDRLIANQYVDGIDVDSILKNVIETFPGPDYPVTMTKLRARIAKLQLRRNPNYITRINTTAGQHSAAVRQIAPSITSDQIVVKPTPLSVSVYPKTSTIIPGDPPIRVIPAGVRAFRTPIPLAATRDEFTAKHQPIPLPKPKQELVLPIIPVVNDVKPSLIAPKVVTPQPSVSSPPPSTQITAAALLAKEAPVDSSGKVPMRYADIVDWGKLYRIKYDGTNIHSINKMRQMFGKPPILQISP